MIIVLGVALGGGAGAQSEPDSLALEPLNIVVLIDESGSLDESGVSAEAEAAAMLASIEVSSESAVAVLGFGGQAKDPSVLAVRDLCTGLQQLESDGARRRIQECAATARVRSLEEGYFTDHYNAIREALDVLEASPPGARRIIFLMTDGVLDPGPFSNLGEGDPEAATAEARQLIQEVLGPRARELGVQIWPLGFGDAVDREALKSYASLGIGANPACEAFGRAPTERVVQNADQVLLALLESAANARCQVLTVGSQSMNADVRTSRFATDGSIAITRDDATIQITMTAPDGTVLNSERAPEDDRYELVTTERAVAVRFRDVGGGTWNVQATAPTKPVALWEARVEAWVEGPSQAPSGEMVDIRVRIRDRIGLLTELGPDELDRLFIEARTSGGGSVALEGPTISPDGQIEASFLMPPCPTTVMIDIAIRIEGFVDVSEPIRIPCDDRTGFYVEATSPCIDVPPGGHVPVVVSWSNQSPQARQLTATIDTASPSGWKVNGESTFVVPSGSSDSTSFMFEHTGGTTDGMFEGRAAVTDTTAGVEHKADTTICGTFVPSPVDWVPRIAAGAAIAVGLYLGLRTLRAHGLRTSEGLEVRLLADKREIDRLEGAGSGPLTFRVGERLGSPALLLVDESTEGETYAVIRKPVGLLWPKPGLLRVSRGETTSDYERGLTTDTGLRHRRARVELEIWDPFLPTNIEDDESADIEDQDHEEDGR